jgi:hypothetical protein
VLIYWLLEDLRNVAAARLAADRVSEPEASHSVWYGLRLILNDIETWGFVSIPHNKLVFLSARTDRKILDCP